MSLFDSERLLWKGPLPPEPYSNTGGQTLYGLNILDLKRGDVTGDSVVDTVLLTGGRGDSENEDIRLIIRDGHTGSFSSYPLPHNHGRNARLFLADFTGDLVQNILIVLPGSSENPLTSYLYACGTGDLKPLFQGTAIRAGLTGQAALVDGYRLLCCIEGRPSVTLDASGWEAFEDCFDGQGHPVDDTACSFSPICELFPAKLDGEEHYSLISHQRLLGPSGQTAPVLLQTFWEVAEARLRPRQVHLALET